MGWTRRVEVADSVLGMLSLLGLIVWFVQTELKRSSIATDDLDENTMFGNCMLGDHSHGLRVIA